MATKFKNGIDVTSTSAITAANATDIPLTVKSTNTATGTSSWTGSVSSITVTGVVGTISPGLYVSGSNIRPGTIVTSATNNAGTWTVGLNASTSTTQSSTTLYFSQSANIQEWDAPANSATVTSASSTSSTLTYNAINSFSAGQLVTVTGMSLTGYNVTNAFINTASSTQFTILSAANPGTASNQTGAATTSLITINNGGRLTSSAPLWISGGVSTTSDTVTDAALVIPVNKYIYTTPSSTTISNGGQRRLLGMSNGTLTAGGYTFAANGLQLGPGPTGQVNYLWFSPGTTNLANYAIQNVNNGSMFVFNPSSFHNGYGTASSGSHIISETGTLGATELLASGTWTTTGGTGSWTKPSTIPITSVSGNTFTVVYTTASDHGYVKDQLAAVSGFTLASQGYNTTGLTTSTPTTNQIIAVPSSTTFVLVNSTTGAPSSYDGCVVDSFRYTRAASSNALYNSALPSTNTQYQITYSISGLTAGTQVTMALGGTSVQVSGSANNTATISSATNTASTLTYTTSANHSFTAGQYVTVTGLTPSGYNVTNAVILSVTSNTFTVASTANPSTSSGTGTATVNVNGIWGPRMASSLTSYSVPATTGQAAQNSIGTGFVVHSSGSTEWTGTITVSVRPILPSIPSFMTVDSANNSAIEIRSSATALTGGATSPRNIFIGRNSGRYAVQNGTIAATATVTNAASTASTLTYTTSSSHNFGVGQLVTITGGLPSGYQVVNAPITAIGGSSFTIASTANPGNSNAGGTAYVGGTGPATVTASSGYYNTALGDQALANLTTGFGNVAVGTQALQNNTTANANTAVGASALAGATSGSSNTAVGYATLGGLTSGTNNTAVGRDALVSTTTGFSQVAIGHSSLSASTTGNSNVAIGNFAGAGNPFSLVAIGNNAGGGLTTGIQNVFVGRDSGRTITTGQNNVFLGYQAGYGPTGTEQTNNVSNSTAIGYQAVTTASNQIVIGNSSVTQTRLQGELVVGGGTSGAVTLPYRAVTSGPITLDATDYTINCTSAGFTVNLPTAVGITGRVYVIKNTAATGTITVDGSGTEPIDGAQTFTLDAQHESITIQSTGSATTGWIIL